MAGVAGHWEILERARAQAGVVGYVQLEGLGWSRRQADRQVVAGRWQRLHPGIYLTSTGEPGWGARAWAAHLYYGQSSVLFAGSALQVEGVLQQVEPITVSVPNAIHRKPQPNIVVVRTRQARPVSTRGMLPPRTRIDYATLDACSHVDSAHLIEEIITCACRSRRTNVKQLIVALHGLPSLRNRGLIRDILELASTGAESVLEIRAVRDVLQAHGLPTGRGQSAEFSNGQRVYRDRAFDEYGVVIEFDGRLGHADGTSRHRDHRRDNAVARTGRITLRYGWHDVRDSPCEVAAEIATVLRTRGWLGTLEPCAPDCRALRWI